MIMSTIVKSQIWVDQSSNAHAEAPLKRIAISAVEKLCLLVMSRAIKAARKDLAGRDDRALSSLGIDRDGVGDLLSKIERRQSLRRARGNRRLSRLQELNACR
jgi:hypothetical protein